MKLSYHFSVYWEAQNSHFCDFWLHFWTIFLHIWISWKIQQYPHSKAPKTKKKKKKNFAHPDPLQFFDQMIWNWSDALDRSATATRVEIDQNLKTRYLKINFKAIFWAYYLQIFEFLWLFPSKTIQYDDIDETLVKRCYLLQ